MLETLSAGWALWLLPAVIVCIGVLLFALRAELGLRKSKQRAAEKAAQITGSVPAANQQEDGLPLEVILAAAAAYCSEEKNRGR